LRERERERERERGIPCAVLTTTTTLPRLRLHHHAARPANAIVEIDMDYAFAPAACARCRFATNTSSDTCYALITRTLYDARDDARVTIPRLCEDTGAICTSREIESCLDRNWRNIIRIREIPYRFVRSLKYYASYETNLVINYKK